MSGDIGPGDLVVCVDAGARPCNANISVRMLRKGALYRVRGLGMSPSATPCLLLVDIPTPHGFFADRFRKLNDEPDNAEIIARIRKCRILENSHG